ncbi:hypothetical protein NQ318_017670 [Aromia moschata]|uniref:Mos1 transposase HTH domain-containing protein n=1 Tax=Aromia moschata TaxID=1265417 RepID=A0AAV8XAW1_9CUCU|nr:hypothetical protein NQ318_017670 [Aromia moschata]
MLSVQMEQRVNLTFLVKLGKTFTEAYAMLKEVYGNECLSRTQVFERFKRFKEGRETTEDDPHPGRLSTSKTDENIETFGKLIREDRRLSIRRLAKITGIDKECVRFDLWKTKSWKIHQDNSAHSALSVKALFAKYGITVLEHPPYSPDFADFASCDYFYFPRSNRR